MTRGPWPCKLPTNMSLAQGEGLEMTQPRLGSPPQAQVHEASPTCVTAAATSAWDNVPRGTANCSYGSDVATKNAIASWGQGMRYGTGGGVFASIRGVHTSWQLMNETEAASVRQKACLSLGLSRPRAVDGSEEVNALVGSRLPSSISVLDTVEHGMRRINDQLSRPLDHLDKKDKGGESGRVSSSAWWVGKELPGRKVTRNSHEANVYNPHGSAFSLWSSHAIQQEARRNDFVVMATEDTEGWRCGSSYHAGDDKELPSLRHRVACGSDDNNNGEW
ncbi:hypothetical protein GUITHDRAFT_118737 [Guillardia theta CCMP2712]|uniref:Uncharacterized protein n=1 Tax=Guillardia theta (strain CCMP2712) TaxID=905079 RepID=L1IFP4_GUITC|nr:hypothetical protein GUITHDRAFT_118737 [Guillardia theta CCMP2712]EKX35081.1 hypothetical protein GUITHDRAFT_118737 [Guillardia theta CCMP2712]|mmetsp:Transcript_18820/g.61810  ORF Transcript_18820/g.61810 Transcript_18820/m.61810 type:complete len:277 (-) Transcript_18820:4789-5619(-)|eukprot:XP_005822061.1 hypothetical protein GUITHDRAFT_118737 [Guillardia theta CCMP2712]